MRNPKLLSLLRKGCSITFPSGIALHRIPDEDFIESGAFGEDNRYVGIDTYELNEAGLEEALEYEESVANFQEEDDELTEKEREEEDWQ
jgi:hypothetical protein